MCGGAMYPCYVHTSQQLDITTETKDESKSGKILPSSRMLKQHKMTGKIQTASERQSTPNPNFHHVQCHEGQPHIFCERKGEETKKGTESTKLLWLVWTDEAITFATDLSTDPVLQWMKYEEKTRCLSLCCSVWSAV